MQWGIKALKPQILSKYCDIAMLATTKSNPFCNESFLKKQNLENIVMA